MDQYKKVKKDLAYCKILLYGTAYGYILTKWLKNNINFLYIDADSLITRIKTWFVKDIGVDVEKWFVTHGTETRKIKEDKRTR